MLKSELGTRNPGPGKHEALSLPGPNCVQFVYAQETKLIELKTDKAQHVHLFWGFIGFRGLRFRVEGSAFTHFITNE